MAGCCGIFRNLPRKRNTARGLSVGSVYRSSERPPRCLRGVVALCRPDTGGRNRTRWLGPLASAVEQWGLDIYTEVCCAMGEDVSFDEYGEAVEAAGSRLQEDRLEFLFDALRAVPFQVCALPECRFLHFGSLPRLVASGLELTRRDDSPEAASQTVLNTVVYADGRLEGGEAWVEGCAIESVLHLAGDNVVTGLDLTRPLPLPRGACLDIVPGRDGEGNPFHCLRVCHIHDNPKATLIQGGAWCGVPLAGLPARAGVSENGIWPEELPARERSLWFARVHPIVANPGDYADWLWLLESAGAGPSQWAKWHEAKRCSMADMARLTDHDAFMARRERLHCRATLPAFINALGSADGPSAHELATAVLASDDDGQALATRFCSLVTEHARAAEHEPLGSAIDYENGDRHIQKPWDRPRFAAQTVGSVPVFETFEADSNQTHRPLGLASALHTLGSVLAFIDEIKPEWVQSWVARVAGTGNASMRAWLRARGFAEPAETGAAWVHRLQFEGFEQLRRAVVYSAPARRSCPTGSLNVGETVWGRAPVRLDLAGGWSDTPPYTLEHGGCVLNAAVDLDGQPPIQAYGRIIPEPVIRLVSTDQDSRVEIRTLAELLDYRNPASEFALPKAVLALSGLVPDAAPSPVGARLEAILAQFGGGIELTTSAAVPRGSGLGTSSIMGAVLLAIVHRLMGRDIERRALFHEVLSLEQSLTTGGGWQDQIGGMMPGVKLILTTRGLVPEPEMLPVPGDLLEPDTNGGSTLLYYTGITRLAKNILGKVVGQCLDRDRAALEVLERIRSLPPRVAQYLAQCRWAEFGRSLGAGWELKKEINPAATNAQLEAIFASVAPFVHGAKIMGAGGGGFMLLVCKSREDAVSLREMLASGWVLFGFSKGFSLPNRLTGGAPALQFIAGAAVLASQREVRKCRPVKARREGHVYEEQSQDILQRLETAVIPGRRRWTMHSAGSLNALPGPADA